MKTSYLRLAAAPVLLFVAACSSAPSNQEDTNELTSDLQESTIVSRGMEWVDAELHYCQAPHGAVDGDTSCWAWEGPSHVCDRESNAAWNAYRSDCSGFVTWSWGLAANVHGTDGGYATGNFAPYNGVPYGESTVFSHTVQGIDLQPGDALNKIVSSPSDGHIILFKQWVTKGESAILMEEPGCSASPPHAHEFTSNLSISGDQVTVEAEGYTFYAITFDDVSGSSGGGSSSSSSSGGSSSGGSSSGGSSAAPDACSEGDGFCTETLQCDGGHWIVRNDDPTACSKVENVEESCKEGDGYCTETLQCDGGHWVPRTGDPAACTSGPGA
jgi:uncharacterized membrane protein YgcG